VKRAAGAAAIGAVLCAAVLAGCQSHTAASQPDGVVPAGASISSTISSTSSSNNATYPAAPGGASAGTVPSGGPAPTSTSNVDSDLNTINQQLDGLDSALAKATQSPPDGD
jgi:hypothetical protein